MKIALFDTETTGLLKPSIVPVEQQPRIIEFGLAIVENKEIVKEYNWLINPEQEISAEITKITGIKNEDLTWQKTFIDLYQEIENTFIGVDVLICHNAHFDVSMLSNELKRIDKFENFPIPETIICTVLHYKALFGHRPKLQDIYKHFVGEKLEQTHRAIDDVKALHKALIYAKFYNIFEE